MLPISGSALNFSQSPVDSTRSANTETSATSTVGRTLSSVSNDALNSTQKSEQIKAQREEEVMAELGNPYWMVKLLKAGPNFHADLTKRAVESATSDLEYKFSALEHIIRIYHKTES